MHKVKKTLSETGTDVKKIDVSNDKVKLKSENNTDTVIHNS